MMIIDFRKLLPSQARAAVYKLLLEKFQISKLNDRADTTFRFEDALALFAGDDNKWVRITLLEQCFELAKRDWEKQNPKCWDNDKQRAFRGKKNEQNLD